jgi:hypothetical protein
MLDRLVGELLKLVAGGLLLLLPASTSTAAAELAEVKLAAVKRA